MIDFKSPSPSARPDAFLRYKSDLRGALKSAIAAKNLSEQIEVEAAISHSFEYSSPRAFLGLLSQRGVKTYSFYGDGHREFRHRLLSVGQASQFPDLGMDVRYRRGLEDHLTKHEIVLVRSHLEGIIQGRGELEYSPPPTRRDLRSGLRITDFERSVLVLTSSPDEVEASVVAGLRPDHLLLDDDLQFIRTVLSLASSTPSVNFIIRVHPRLAPNRRDNETSHLLTEIRKFAAEAPFNVTWNFPEDGYSLYDLLPIIEFVIAYRSSAAHEAMALGYRCFFADSTKNPTTRRGGGDETNPDVATRFSDFLSVTKNDPADLVAVWRFLATHLLRVRIDVDNLYELRAEGIYNSRNPRRNLTHQSTIWRLIRARISPAKALTLNFLLWSSRHVIKRRKRSLARVSFEKIPITEMENWYRLWGSQLEKNTEVAMVGMESRKLRLSLGLSAR
jgi:hypothetical protein